MAPAPFRAGISLDLCDSRCEEVGMGGGGVEIAAVGEGDTYTGNFSDLNCSKFRSVPLQ